MSYKVLFSRALGADPRRLHFAAHSHHLWPDASFDAQVRAWADANRYADRKWERIFAEVIPEAQRHVARELRLPSPETVVFAPNTHDFLVRVVSAIGRRPARILATDGEFHTFRRQAARWEEADAAVVTRVATEPFEDFPARLLKAAAKGRYDLILTSQVFFRSGRLFDAVDALAALADPAGPWVLVDGYHGFMAAPTDLGRAADRMFYVAGGYKYAMSGEGVCFLHAPPGFAPRPAITGWFAEFGDLEGPPGGVGYATDGGRFWGATFDASGLYRFNAVRRVLDEWGLDTATVAAHARGLQTIFAAAVAEGRAGRLDKAELLNPVAGDGPRARFLAFRHPQARAWQAALLEADIITDVRDDVIRFGFGLYHDEADTARLIETCARVL